MATRRDILDAAGRVTQGEELFAKRPVGKLAVTHLGQRAAVSPNARSWSAEYHVIDNLLRPLLEVVGKP